MNDNLKHVEPFNGQIKTIHKNFCISLVCVHIGHIIIVIFTLQFLFLSLLVLFVSVNVIALATRMKQVNDQRERLAARKEERKEKEEKWKLGHIQEKGKKQNPKDARKRKVEYETTCKGKVHFIAVCINFSFGGNV